MRIEEFTALTGYVPNSTEEFEQIERDRKVFNVPVKAFCAEWINAYYFVKRNEVIAKRDKAEHWSEREAYDIMLQNMYRAYRNY